MLRHRAGPRRGFRRPDGSYTIVRRRDGRLIEAHPVAWGKRLVTSYALDRYGVTSDARSHGYGPARAADALSIA